MLIVALAVITAKSYSAIKGTLAKTPGLDKIKRSRLFRSHNEKRRGEVGGVLKDGILITRQQKHIVIIGHNFAKP